MNLSKLKNKISELSNNPGVYLFKDKSGEIIYVGKATNLRSRVGSYFAPLRRTPSRPSPWKREGVSRPIETLIHEVADVGVQVTDSVLEALILESNLIQKYQPKYNAIGKDDKSFAYFAITKDEFPRVLILRKTEIAKAAVKKIYGPYTSKRQMEIALKIIRKIFPFHSLPTKTEKGCLDFQLGRCPGPYAGAISKADYQKNIRGIQMILEGKKKSLLKKLKKEMSAYADKEEFEKAQVAKHQIFALSHIRDVALISRGDDNLQFPISNLKNIRIEAYDISNISGDHAVGSMVVFKNEKADKSQYRKFKIKTVEGIDDVGAMREVLLRRFRHTLTPSPKTPPQPSPWKGEGEFWPQPELILLDGGKGHLNMAQKLLSDLGLIIPTAAVAKGPKRKNLELRIMNYELNKEINNILSNKQLLKRIMDEAHRFAISYHKKLRRKNLLF